MQETAPRRSASSVPSKEVLFDINDAAFSSDEFRMYQFKIKRCPRARPHDWTLCPFAHPGEKAKRRDPRKKKYSGTACPDFRKGGSCPRGDSCPFAHGVFECWLHPSRYRTQMCTDGENCERRVCFFAHLESELREAEADPVLLNFQLHPEMFGGAPSPAQFYPPYQHGGYPVPDFMAGGVPHPHYGLHLPSAMAPMPLGMAQPALAAGDSTAPAGTVQPDHSAPCTPTAPSLTPTLTPATSQDSATLLAHLQALQQQQQQAVGGSAHGGASQWAAPSASLPASVAQSPAQADAGTGVAGAPGGPRSVSASASGGTLGSSSSPPISPTGVAALSELTQNLNCGGGTAALEALLQQQQQHGGGGGGGDAARQLASLLGGDHAQQGSDAAALAALLQQQLGLGASSYDQTALLVALHSLSLGGSLPECHPPAGGLSAGLIRHASDVYMQQRAAAAVAALTPPGHGLVSHRRSMDNSMLAQLHSLSRSSPLPLDPYLHQDSPAAPDTGPQAARLSPVSIPSTHRHHHRSPQQQQQQHTPDMAACLTNGSLTPPSPSYLAHLTATPASPYANLGGHGAAHPHQQRTSSPLAAGGPLHPIVTLTGGQQDVGMTSAGMQLPPTPQTAPANMGRTAWSNQLGCIDEEQPGGAGELPDSPPSLPCVYKTLSDPSALIRNLSFDNILAELPRSSSQVSLTALQPGATSAKGAEGVREGGDLVNGTQAGRDRQGGGEEGGT